MKCQKWQEFSLSVFDMFLIFVGFAPMFLTNWKLYFPRSVINISLSLFRIIISDGSIIGLLLVAKIYIQGHNPLSDILGHVDSQFSTHMV